jgi:hypothetical protein
MRSSLRVLAPLLILLLLQVVVFAQSPSYTPTATPSTALPTNYPSLSPHSISVVSTIAGTGTASYSGDNGAATSAAINVPVALTFDAAGNSYIPLHNPLTNSQISTTRQLVYCGLLQQSYPQGDYHHRDHLYICG